ncbi:MAG: ERF family protein [Clostridia bacterium]|nr:ERF family protein [Clostridia bacterium]
MEDKNIYEKLAIIQQDLKAPKNQYNSFGDYKYRSCEDILEAVKPLLKKLNLILRLNDELINIGDRYYIKALVAITDIKTEASLSATAYARETENKPKMDAAQITGTASSYARKYALNGLFLIDDTKDADTDEHAKQTGAEPKQEKKATEKQVSMIQSLSKDVKTITDYYKVETLNDLTTAQASEVIGKLKGAK